MNKKISSLIVFIFLFGIFTEFAFAQLIMEQSYVRLTVKPGETIANSMKIHNNSDQNLSIRIYWQDFEYVSPFDGKKKFLPAGTSQYTLSDWITFFPQELTLPPFGKKDINYTINVPNDVHGGYQGVLFFEKLPDQAQKGTGVSIVTRVGSLFFVNTNDREKKASIEDLKIEKAQFQGVFVNTGNTILIPKTIYYVLNAEGLVVDRGESDKSYVPPGGEDEFIIPISEALEPGKYTEVITFDLEEGDSVVKEIDFVKNVQNKIVISQLRD